MKYAELNRDEKKEVTALIANWLKDYTQAVIIRVLEKRDEILENEFAVNLLKELYKREQKEQKDFTDSISYLLDSFVNFKEYDPHNHVLTHSGSYRDILYDMYIKD